MRKRISTILLAVVMIFAVSVTAVAADFTPSVTGKAAPEIVPVTNSAGESAAAILYDADGNEIRSIPVGDLIVTPYSAVQQADTTVKNALVSAYDQINTTTLDTMVSGLDNAVQSYSANMKEKDLVVRDLFDVSLLNEEDQKLLAETGNSIKIRFALDLSSDDLLLVLHNTDEKNWELISNDKTIHNEDGSITAELDSLSPIAFATDGGSLTTDPDAPSSPKTGNETSSLLLWGTIGVGGIALAAVACVIRKRTIQ